MSDLHDTSGRLNRIEAKLDQVAEAIIALARVEERTVAIQELINGVRREQDQIETRLRDLEKASARQGGGFSVYERGFWVVAAAAVGFTVFLVQTFIGG